MATDLSTTHGVNLTRYKESEEHPDTFGVQLSLPFGKTYLTLTPRQIRELAVALLLAAEKADAP